MIFAFLVTINNNTALAQNQSVVILDEKTQSFPISSYTYITKNSEENITAEILVERHRNNLRGERKDTDVINLGTTSGSSWGIFRVHNKSNDENWVLHFGNALNGRIGMVKTIRLTNHPATKTPNTKIDEYTAESFIGNILPIKIPAESKSSFVFYIETDSGMPLVISPKIIKQNEYLKNMQHTNITNIVMFIFFISIIAFFVTSYYIGKNNSSIALASHYLMMSVLFLCVDNNFISQGINNGTILLILYISSLIPLMFASKFFNKMSYDKKPMENMALIVLSIFLIAIASLYLLIMGASHTGIIALTGTICVTFISLIIITALTSGKAPTTTSLFCLGISGTPLAILITNLAIIDILPISSLTINMFWFLQIPASLCFVSSYLISNNHRKTRKKQEDLHKKHEQQSLAQLQKSKDSADQARLLRVIERERELMAELREREVSRTEEMRKSKEMADKANNAKSAFLAVVSHEIRTPMNGILGMVQLLQNTSLTKSQNEYLGIMQKSGDSMMALLNDILDFEKIEHGNMELENIEFNLHQLAHDVIILMSGHAAKNNIELKTEISENVPVNVIGDPTRLRQVLLNLVNNGLKFTEKGYVKIELSVPKNSGDNIVNFAIKDTGIGISKEAQIKLFTPFKQAETSTSRKYGGTGLGLAISSKLIEAMGGKISVNSETGAGSTFSFSIEMEAQNNSMHSPDANECKANDKKARPMNILIVEDNEMNRKVLSGLLSCEGHILHMAQNGMEALDQCKTEQFDLILMDIQMDGLSGLETTAKIRNNSDKNIASTPIIALTGNVMLEDIETFFAAHMNGFIAKPVDSRKLNDVIYNASIGKFENDLPDDFFDNTEEVKQIDIKNIDHELEFDNRDDFEEAETQFNSTEEKDPILSQTVNLTLDRENNYVPKDPVANTPQVHKIKTKTQSDRKTDNEMTEIQKYLMDQKANTKNNEAENTKDISAITPVQEENTQNLVNEKQNDDVEVIKKEELDEILDIEMIQSLMDTLGKEQFSNLLKGFLDKADEIMENINAVIIEGNIPSLGARAHELKGMSGNFGMKKISAIAGEIEKTAKMSQKEDSLDHARKLNAANEQTKAAFQEWQKSL
ncbi:MAG: ATP-binding protein [Alphaproteobacteria bacterium]